MVYRIEVKSKNNLSSKRKLIGIILKNWKQSLYLFIYLLLHEPQIQMILRVFTLIYLSDARLLI